jgi:hypothetical protein
MNMGASVFRPNWAGHGLPCAMRRHLRQASTPNILRRSRVETQDLTAGHSFAVARIGKSVREIAGKSRRGYVGFGLARSRPDRRRARAGSMAVRRLVRVDAMVGSFPSSVRTIIIFLLMHSISTVSSCIVEEIHMQQFCDTPGGLMDWIESLRRPFQSTQRSTLPGKDMCVWARTDTWSRLE